MNSRQLTLLQEIVALCETQSISIWVRGGWAVDFVNPLVQIELKELYPVWRPDLPHLPKHADDTARLRECFTLQ